jgi:hypothetical protein
MFAFAFVAVACSERSADPPPTLEGPDRTTRDAAVSDPADAAADAADDTSTTVVVTTCTNGQKDGDELDVDCGGAVCPPCSSGCSDRTRDGFSSVAAFPDIAACSGGWSLPGLLDASTTVPVCGRVSGNASANPSGAGCNVADLCQVGWHVCEGPAEVAMKTGGAGCAAAGSAGQLAFFVTRQSGPGSAQCGAGANDLFGCGDTGAAADPTTCAPLDRFSDNLCGALPATWSCGADGGEEANNVTKTASEGGGVLCCRD